MNTNIMDQINRVHQARLKQADAKERLLAAERKLAILKSEMYLRGDTHYKAMNLATIHPDVVAAQTRADDAKLDHYRAWIETTLQVMTYSAMRGDTNSPVDHLDEQ